MAEADAIDSAHPRFTADLIGHDKAERTLLNAWNSSRFPHGWLISGPEGIGKATLAFRMARFALADGTPDAPQADMFGGGPETLSIDTESDTFRRIASGGHPDFRYLARQEGKSQILADDVRDVMTFAYRTASGGGWKVILVDGAEQMNTASANALLKPLEEPPARTLFLLVSHAPGRLLPTIRSRCRSLKLSALDEGAVGRLLAERNPDIDPAAAGALARLSDGRAGRALLYADKGALDLYRGFLDLVRTPSRIDRAKVHRLGDELNRKGAEETFDIFRVLVNDWLRRAIRAAACGMPPQDILPGDGAIAHELVAPRGAQAWLDAADEIADMLSKADAPAHLGRKHVLVNAFILLERAALAR